MYSRSMTKVVAALCSVLLPAAIMSAETRGGMVSATNSAMLNGVSFQRTSAFLPGDTLTVPEKSMATITLSGSSILVPPQSSIKLNGDSISLRQQTAASITTTVGLAALVEKIRIRPATAASESKFEVGRFNGKIVVSAKQGSILIEGSPNANMVAEGKSAVIPDPEPQKPGSAPTATTGSTLGNMPTWVAALIATAAIGAAGAAAIATTGTPGSSTHP
jgi:hypothetical protein